MISTSFYILPMCHQPYASTTYFYYFLYIHFGLSCCYSNSDGHYKSPRIRVLLKCEAMDSLHTTFARQQCQNKGPH